MKFKLVVVSLLLLNGTFVKNVQAFDFDVVAQGADLAAFQDEDDNDLDAIAVSVKNIKTEKQEITLKDKLYYGMVALWMFGILKPYQYCKATVAVVLARMQRSL